MRKLQGIWLQRLRARARARPGPAARHRMGLRARISPRGVSRIILIASGGLIGFLAVFVCVRQGMALLIDSPAYALKSLQVQQPRYLSVEQVTRLCEVAQGENLMALKLEAIRSRIMEHPNVKDAMISRVLPSTLHVEVVERDPLAQIDIGKRYVVDTEGVVLTWHEGFKGKSWPMIEGLDSRTRVSGNKIRSQELHEVLQILLRCRDSALATWLTVLTVRMEGQAGYVLHTDAGITVRMAGGLTDLQIQEKLDQLSAVLEDLDNKGITTDNIDLRFEDIVVSPVGKARSSRRSAKGMSVG